MKKKFLALLLTVMMVAVLVPAIVASALTPVALQVNAAADGVLVDDRAEVAVHDPLLDEDNVEVLNKDGVRVGYYETLAEAVANVRAGDTVRLLDNLAISATLELSGSFVLDGNGYTLTQAQEEEEEPEAPAPVDPEDTVVPMPEEPEDPTQPEEEAPVAPEGSEGGTDVPVDGGDDTPVEDGDDTPVEDGGDTPVEGGEDAPAVLSEDTEEAFDTAIRVTGNGTDIEIRNLTVDVRELGIGIDYYLAEPYDVADLTLNNCRVTAQVAVWAHGNNAALTIKGTSGSYYGWGTGIAVHRGFVDIYGGTFASEGEVIAASSDATVAIYGGTYRMMDSPFDVISSYNGATVILAGGEYATTAESGATVFYTDGGSIKVLDGKYYLADAGVPVIDGDGVQIYGGFFYGQEEVDLSAAQMDAAYGETVFTYEDPTFPANTKLDYVKELGYLSMKQVTYDAAWMAENGYDVKGAAYDVTNGLYNEYPVSYYAFELQRAYWYLGNGGSLTVTQNVELNLDEALSFRQRPVSSTVTLQSVATGDAAYTLCVNVDGSYPLIATGGTYNIANLKLINNLGSAILLDQDSTDAFGGVLNLQSGAMVAGYKNHSIWVGAYATVNMYEGSYVHAAAGVNGNYDGTGFAVMAMVGGNLNMYGGNVGYTRQMNENGQYIDVLATAQMNTIAVGVGNAATCVSNINIYNGKLGKTATDLSYATSIFNVSDQSERIDGTKIYIENGEFNAALNNIFHLSGRDITVNIKGGTFNGATARCTTSAAYSDLVWVDGVSADVHSTVVIEGGSFLGGRDQFSILGYADVSVSNSYHSGAMSSVFACHGNPEMVVKVTDVTVDSTVTAFWCNGSSIEVKGGTFVVKGASWGKNAFAVEGDATTAGDITVTGGQYSVSNGYFVSIGGLAQRTVTVNGSEFNSIGGSCFHMNTEGRADLVINGGTYSNMYGGAHQIETWGDPSKTVGSITINGDAQFVRGGNASGRMIKFYGANNVTINGGYFDSKTSEAIVIEKSGDRSYAPSLTFTINGGTFRNDVDGRGLIYVQSGLSTTMNITGGVFQNYSNAWGPCLDVGGTVNVYGGDFESICAGGSGSDACVTVSNGTCNIYAGTFRGNGMCVVRGLSGKTGGESDVNGSITTVSTSRLNIYGGVFTLDNNSVRTAGKYDWDAVVRCGGGSTYAFVSIYGGTFISNSGCADRVINKNNVHSSINITGGVFLASKAQNYYYKSNGMAATGGTEYPTTPYAKGENDPVINYGGKQYNQLIVGAGASPFNGKMEDGAQIRLTQTEEASYNGGLRFVTRYNAASVASLKSLAGGSLENVTFGTLIIKAELLNGLTSFSHEALVAAGIEDYMDIVAVEGLNGSESIGYTVAAALSNISASDYETVYAAVGYVEISLPSGGSICFYSEFDVEKNARSIAQVAEAALDDVRDDQTQGYVYESIAYEGKYSRYTVEQQNIMLTFVPTEE